MSVHPKWLGYEQWTILEAAQVLAGVEPFDHAIVGDDPHKVLARIADETKREVVKELYRQSKDAINTGGLAISERSRTGRDGNTRVVPAEYLAWAQSRGFALRPELAELVVPGGDDVAAARTPTHPRWISRSEVMGAFAVEPDADANERFWDAKLAEPPKWLKAARELVGVPGISSRWNPMLVAVALLERKHMSPTALDKVMREDFSEQYEEWKEETRDRRR